jgi:predicted PurR-regulated permease PerM
MPQQKQRMFLGLVLAVLVLFLLDIAWPFASAMILASIVAVMMHPANARLRRRLRPGVASLVTTTATVLILGATFTFICITAVKTTRTAYNSLKKQTHEEAVLPGLIVSTTDRIADSLATRVPLPKALIRARVTAGMDIAVHYLFSKTQSVLVCMTSIVITSILAMIFLYYLLLYGDTWLRRAAALAPLNPDVTAKLLQTAHQSIIANVNGVLVVALAQGLLLSLGFRFVGIATPLLWGFVGAIASLVPFVGATLVWVPAVIGFVVTGSYWKAIVLGLWGLLVVGSIDNILRPLVIGAREKQNPVLVGFAMLGGTYAIGPLGLLIGPLVVSLTGAVVEEIHKSNQDAYDNATGDHCTHKAA